MDEILTVVVVEIRVEDSEAAVAIVVTAGPLVLAVLHPHRLAVLLPDADGGAVFVVDAASHQGLLARVHLLVLGLLVESLLAHDQLEVESDDKKC